MVKPGHRHQPAPLLICLLVPWAITAAGCGFWEEFRSNDYSFKATFHPPPPLEVLASGTTDGGKIAKALARLKEPAQNKGSEREQELAILYLTKAAREDKDAACRLAAIASLSTYKDPRAVQAIIDAYYASESFAPEHGTVIRMQSMTALGKVGKDNPKALELLVRVVQAPAVDAAKSSEDTKQVNLRERLAAARALASFKGYQATEALVRVLKTEKDVALHDAAHQSLVAVTGKKLPPDAKAWEDLLNNPATPRDGVVAQDNGNRVKLIQPILRTGFNKDQPPQ